MVVGKLLIYTGCIGIVLASAVHAEIGYTRLLDAIKKQLIATPPFAVYTSKTVSPQELKFIWVAYASHLAFIAIITATLAHVGVCARTAIVLCGIVPVIDAILLRFLTRGFHIGSPILGISGVLVMTGGLLI